ncbi:MAG: hypothetical protein JSU83_12605 [Deltaproteobacteria bacterium]|nr:MAG: hypothetical protein JSU83_12605 [Deltaproteobacteria bacterium]
MNLSRGDIADHEALQDALAAGPIAGAGLDVFREELPDPDDPPFLYNDLTASHLLVQVYQEIGFLSFFWRIDPFTKHTIPSRSKNKINPTNGL